MAQDGDAAGPDEPEHRGEGRGDDHEGNADDEETSVKLAGRELGEAKVQISAAQLADPPHATNDEEYDEEQREVGQQRVDAEHDEDSGIVAAEVAKVVVDARLDLAEVLGLAEALDVEELRDGLQVRESRGYRLRADV